MKKSAVEKLIEDLEKLSSIGIDGSEIRPKDTIGTLGARKGISAEKLRSLGLDPEKKIGHSKSNVQQAYRGNGNFKPLTDEEIKKLEELGINFDKQKSAVEILIEDLEKLKCIGIDGSDIQYKDTIGTMGARRGISEEKLRSLGLDPEKKIGHSKSNVQQAYRGNGNHKPLTDEEIKKLKELGVNLYKQKRKSVVEKLIEDLEKLKCIGINVLDIQKKDTIGTLATRYQINIEQIESMGLNLKEKIGSSVDTVRQLYSSRDVYKLLKENERRKLESLVIGDKRSRTGKEIAEASIASLKQIEMSDKEYEIFKQLKKQEKENER